MCFQKAIHYKSINCQILINMINSMAFILFGKQFLNPMTLNKVVVIMQLSRINLKRYEMLLESGLLFENKTAAVSNREVILPQDSVAEKG